MFFFLLPKRLQNKGIIRVIVSFTLTKTIKVIKCYTFLFLKNQNGTIIEGGHFVCGNSKNESHISNVFQLYIIFF